jgi:hypothetical protein
MVHTLNNNVFNLIYSIDLNNLYCYFAEIVWNESGNVWTAEHAENKASITGNDL